VTVEPAVAEEEAEAEAGVVVVIVVVAPESPLDAWDALS
jgi:hypothetical protein